MTVVSDASPITTLLKAGRENLLREMFGAILVPQAVADELRFSFRPAGLCAGAPGRKG